MRKVLWIFLLAVMCCNTAVQAGTYTNGDFEYSINEDGYAVIMAYTGSDTDLVIPEYIDGIQVTEIGEDAFEYCGMESVTIPDSITIIEDGAFCGCRSLNSIKLPEHVTAIGEWAFTYCDSLSSIELPAEVYTIGKYAFAECGLLDNISVSEKSEYYTQIDGVLFDKAVKTLVSYPAGKTADVYNVPDGVSEIGAYAFGACVNIKNIILPDSVTTIGTGAFDSCENMCDINLPDSITKIGAGAFRGCENISNLDLPDGISLINDETFYSCTNLSDISIPDGVTIIGDRAFFGCTSINNIVLPNELAMIGDRAFAECEGLNGIELPDNVRQIGGNPFTECNLLSNVNVSERNCYYTQIDGVLFDKEMRTLVSYPAGKTADIYSVPDEVSEIGKYAFWGCGNLNDIELPYGMTVIKDCAFFMCSSLNNIELPESVTTLGERVFFGCENLESIRLPDSITEIGAVDSDTEITFIVSEGSYACQWAQENSVDYIYDSESYDYDDYDDYDNYDYYDDYDYYDEQPLGFDSELVGAWVDFEEENGFILYEDGTFSEGDDAGIFYTENGQLIIEVDGDTVRFDYKIADDILTLIRENGETLVLRKK